MSSREKSHGPAYVKVPVKDVKSVSAFDPSTLESSGQQQSTTQKSWGDQLPQLQPWKLSGTEGVNGCHFYHHCHDPFKDQTHNPPVLRIKVDTSPLDHWACYLDFKCELFPLVKLQQKKLNCSWDRIVNGWSSVTFKLIQSRKQQASVALKRLRKRQRRNGRNDFEPSWWLA